MAAGQRKKMPMDMKHYVRVSAAVYLLQEKKVQLHDSPCFARLHTELELNPTLESSFKCPYFATD